jgi:hypothetical protein
MTNGVRAFWDANRYNEPNHENPRFTFGESLIEGSEGSIRLYPDGSITIQKLGKEEKDHPYKINNIEFAGDCVYITQRHFIDCMISGKEFEPNENDYLKSLAVQEAVYRSAELEAPVAIE